MTRFLRAVDERKLAEREEAADRALYAVDPDFACALGYVAPRTRAGALRHPTAHAVRALPNVLTPNLTRGPLDQLSRLSGSHRLIGAPYSSLALRSGFLRA
jgi:hypothetical protein